MYQPPPNTKPLELRGAHLKIKRAKKHIAELDAERIRFFGDNKYVGVPKFNPETNRTLYILETLPEIPEDIAAILGDAVHNLRAALDHLACELVRSTGADPKGIYFPIFDSIEKYQAQSDGKTKGMPKEAKDVIDGIRPYAGANDGLWSIHQLDIIDKHRLLLAVVMKVGSWQVTLDQQGKWYGFAFPAFLQAGDIIGDVEGNHESDKQMSITVDISFGEPEVLIQRPMVETLTELAQYVENIISFFG